MKTVTGQVSITLSPEEEKRIALEYLYKEFGWSRDHFIEDGMVKRNVTQHTTHAWEETETLYEASYADDAIYLLCNHLED